MLGTVQVLQGWEKFRSMSGNIQQLLQILQMTVQSYYMYYSTTFLNVGAEVVTVLVAFYKILNKCLNCLVGLHSRACLVQSSHPQRVFQKPGRDSARLVPSRCYV